MDVTSRAVKDLSLSVTALTTRMEANDVRTTRLEERQLADIRDLRA